VPPRPGLSPFARASEVSNAPSARADAALRRLARRLLQIGRVSRRGGAIAAWTTGACVLQSVLLTVPGRPKIRFARVYWSVVCKLLGMEVRMIGAPASGSAARAGGSRPVIYVSNHSSWIDVAVLGGRLEACFVAKEDVGRWPVIGTVSRLGRTIFVSRQRKTTGRERDDMRWRLSHGDDLILFPEGTSSDGARVLPFHSAFFAVAKPNAGAEDAQADLVVPLIQPVSVVYDRLGGLPVCHVGRPVFAWYGDMDLASHFWRLGRFKGMRASVMMHPVIDPLAFPSRKALAQAAWCAVADGAARLRQNRIDDERVKIATPVPPERHGPTIPLDTGHPSFA